MHWDQFRKGLSRLVTLVVLIGAVFTLGVFTLGPALFPVLFGRGFVLGHIDFAFLAGASAAFMTALALAQALIAMLRYLSPVLAWSAGVASFLALLTLKGSLVVRVERGFLGGTLVAAGAMGALTLVALKNPAAVLTVEESGGVAFPEQMRACSTCWTAPAPPRRDCGRPRCLPREAFRACRSPSLTRCRRAVSGRTTEAERNQTRSKFPRRAARQSR